MPTYKLIYFNLTGLAESIRYLFHYRGTKFEDERFAMDDWLQFKLGMPMGQVPVLEIDGKRYNQSRAIGRYLAKMYNLYGSDEIEALEIDSTIDNIEDMRYRMPMGQVPVLEIDGKRYNQYIVYHAKVLTRIHFAALSIYYWEKDPVFKEKMKQTAFEKLSMYLKNFEEQVKKNDGYFVRGKLTWVDIMYAAYNEMLNALADKDIHEDYPELKKLVDKVNALPNIKAYREKRPKTMF